jgi:hypothetical protein
MDVNDLEKRGLLKICYVIPDDISDEKEEGVWAFTDIIKWIDAGTPIVSIYAEASNPDQFVLYVDDLEAFELMAATMKTARSRIDRVLADMHHPPAQRRVAGPVGMEDDKEKVYRTAVR